MLHPEHDRDVEERNPVHRDVAQRRIARDRERDPERDEGVRREHGDVHLPVGLVHPVPEQGRDREQHERAARAESREHANALAPLGLDRGEEGVVPLGIFGHGAAPRERGRCGGEGWGYGAKVHESERQTTRDPRARRARVRAGGINPRTRKAPAKRAASPTGSRRRCSSASVACRGRRRACR